jgi:hypothetical protein
MNKDWKMSRKKRISRKKLTVVSLVAIPAVAGLGFAVTGSAFAGTNGQQIALCQPKSDYRTATIEGPNQNGERTVKEVGDLTSSCKTVEGFFWKGRVKITWDDSVSGDRVSPAGSLCTVPAVSDSDTVSCFGPDFFGIASAPDR